MDADVVVCGGGLAGLTLARQLRRELGSTGDIRVLVVEPQRRPLPEACHKVGESTIEVGTHYLAEVLDLKEYLTREHLPKNGLRFYSGPAGLPLSDRNELGPSEAPIVPSFQVDRGKLENDLRDRLEGATLLEGTRVVDVELGEAEAPHRVVIEDGDSRQRRRLSCRWVVDATGRRQLLQRKLGLRRPSANPQSAAWFRVKGHVKVNDLVSPSEARWHSRDVDGTRWLSTVHLCGVGYWVWIIPLSTGYTSVGIVAQPGPHPFDTFNRPESAREWLRVHEAELAAHLENAPWEDFRVVKEYSYRSERCFSAARWTCVGEAGVFVDPLYSQGTDYIALANSFTVELIREDWSAGTVDADRVAIYNAILLGWCDELTRVLSANTKVLSEADVFGAKLWCDYFFYWTCQAPFFFRGVFSAPVSELEAFEKLRLRYSELHHRAQSLLEAWADLKTVTLSPGRPFSPLPMFPSVLADQHLELLHDRSVEETRLKMERDIAGAEGLLVELVLLALRGVGEANARRLADRIELADWALPIDPARVALDGLDRRERRGRLPPLARDLERALGRWGGTLPPLADLVRAAGIRLRSVPAEPVLLPADRYTAQLHGPMDLGTPSLKS